MPLEQELPFLLRLLDDDAPEVRNAIEEKLKASDGDISNDVAALGMAISKSNKKRLSHWLEPGRRLTLEKEWIVPSGGRSVLSEDWDAFENLLRLISDFLHDGITLRPSLSDCLDLLVDEIREDLRDLTSEDLRHWLFNKGPFSQRIRKTGEAARLNAPEHFDLAAVIYTRRGNATSLGCLYMLLGHRLGLDVQGCNYPGNFLCKIDVCGKMYLVDCMHSGRCFDVEDLLEGNLEISPKARNAIISPCYLGDVVLRLLKELRYTLSVYHRKDDAELLADLVRTLKV